MKADLNTIILILGFIGVWLGNRHDLNILRDEMRTGFTDLRGQIQHLIDLHINHAERIAKLEGK